MSQNPSPYSPPPADPRGPVPYGAMTRDPLQSARNASVLMMVLGILMLIYGLCNGIGSLATNSDEFARQMQMFNKDQPPPVSLQTMRTMAAVFSGLVLVLAIFMLVSSPYVRRGGTTAITVSLVGVSAIVGLLGLCTLIMVITGFAMPIAFALACVLVIPTALFGLLLVWLIQARRGSGHIRAIQTQYQQQYLMYQQAMQQYCASQASDTVTPFSPPPAPPTSPESSEKPPTQ